MKIRVGTAAAVLTAWLALQPATGPAAATTPQTAPAGADGGLVGDGSATPVSLPDGVRTLKDVAYGQQPEERLDVYLPAQPRGAPVLFMVHGGGWMFGDKANGNVVTNKAAHWLGKGYVLVSVNYPLLPKADPLQQAGAVAKALAFAQRESASWGADSGRFLLMGHSSGSHLVALLAADPALATAQGARPWLGTVALDSAALDVIQIMESRHPRFYDRVFKGDAAFWRTVSPLHRLRGKPQPMLLVCSSQRDDSCTQARSFQAGIVSVGGRASVLPIALSHGEINHKLGLPGTYTDSVDAFVRSLGLP